MQHPAESLEGGVPRVPKSSDRHGPGDRHELSLPAAEEHEESLEPSRAERRQE